MNNNTNVPASKGYGKRPLWQWIVIYLVGAGVLYGIIFYLFFFLHIFGL